MAYIKHSRFLSPSQRQEVAHKVTEVVPVVANPVKIYGKPKAIIDENYLTAATEDAVNNHHAKIRQF